LEAIDKIKQGLYKLPMRLWRAICLPEPEEKRKSLRAFDRVNATAGDVRDVFEPYLATFLTADRRWSPDQVGVALSITSIATILTQTSIGALVDRSKHKRLMMAIASIAVALSYWVIIHYTTLPAVSAAQATIGVAVVVITPATAAISLGLVENERLSQRTGRNEAFNRSGNVITAIAAAGLGLTAGRVWIFYILIALCMGNAILIFAVREQDIDHRVARSAKESNSEQPASWQDLLHNRDLLKFCLAIVLFYVANAALFPLISQELSGKEANAPSIAISVCIIISQITMLPVSVWTGVAANRWGRKPLLRIAFSALLLRSLLCIFSADPLYLVTLQALDGIASGIFSVLTVVVIADLTKGTGRFNMAQGAMNTMIGIGSAFSNFATGLLVKAAGFPIGFTALSVCAAVGLLWLWVAIPETKDLVQPDEG
jgi:MFS family permease